MLTNREVRLVRQCARVCCVVVPTFEYCKPSRSSGSRISSESASQQGQDQLLRVSTSRRRKCVMWVILTAIAVHWCFFMSRVRKELNQDKLSLITILVILYAITEPAWTLVLNLFLARFSSEFTQIGRAHV